MLLGEMRAERDTAVIQEQEKLSHLADTWPYFHFIILFSLELLYASTAKCWGKDVP